MKTILFHGTSADNLPHILKHGLRCDGEAKLWNCSEDAVCFWSVPELMKSEDIEESIDGEYTARQRAIESGQIALCISKDCRVVVIRAEIDESDIEADDSCPNMRGSGAVCVRRNVKLSEITSIEVSNDLSIVRAYFMAIMLEREYSAVEFTEIETKIAKAFQKAGIYHKDIDDLMEFKPVTTKGRKSA